MPGALDRYLAAARTIPRGETRTFLELAQLAGRPGAARAAGRALAACASSSPEPWQRVVRTGGALASNPERAHEQLARLRAEGALPLEQEDVLAWAARVATPCVGDLRRRRFAAAADAALERFDPRAVVALPDVESARARGFVAIDEPERRPLLLPAPRAAPAVRADELAQRLDALDWDAVRRELERRGVCRLAALLCPDACAACLAQAVPARFERSVEMEPHGFGRGSYHYWREPLPEPLLVLRARVYQRLVPLADALRGRRYPRDLEAYWRRCARAGQRRASSILLCYAAGGVNHPHRDIYGAEWFPLQVLVVLSRRGRDFVGGEFVLLEEHAPADLVHEVAVDEGDVVLFASATRVERVGGEVRRVAVRHGMKPVLAGQRFAAGLVFHLAR